MIGLAIALAFAAVGLAGVALGGMIWTTRIALGKSDAEATARVHAAQMEGVAKEQAAEKLRADDAREAAERWGRAEQARADYLEDEIHVAETAKALPPTAAAGSGREQLLQARSAVKRVANLAGGPDRARRGDAGGAGAVPPLPAAGGVSRRIGRPDEAGTLPPGEP